MARILIDGYNVIGIAHADPEAERDAFVRELSRYSKLRGHRVTVVFDGWKDGWARESRKVTGGVEVIFSRLAEKADAVIKRMVDESQEGLIVVSSDREIATHAWARGVPPVSSDAFLDAMERALAGEGAAEETDDYKESGGKGSPRTPSRREKAIIRAIRRL